MRRNSRKKSKRNSKADQYVRQQQERAASLLDDAAPFRRPGLPQRHIDDELGHYFMSEPSISEDGDASSGARVRAPQRVQTTGPYRPHLNSSDDERLYSPHFRPAPPHSPGNTSLSSWDTQSPAMQGRMFFHFTPDRPPYPRRNTNDSGQDESGGEPMGPVRLMNGHPQQQQQQRSQQPAVVARPTQQPAPPPPENQQGLRPRHFMDSFLRTLRLESGGFAPDRTAKNTPNVEAGSREPARRVEQGSDSELNSTTDNSVAGKNDNRRDNMLSPLSSAQDSRVDESLAMTLSDSEDDDEHDEDGPDGKLSGTGRSRLDSEAHHSADDEHSAVRPPRVRKAVGSKPKPIVGHRRTRSGDAAAATIATGGLDWKGMDKDKIPVPSDTGDDDDDDEHNNYRESFSSRSTRAAPGQERQQSKRVRMDDRSNFNMTQPVPRFNIGTYGSTSRSDPNLGWYSQQMRPSSYHGDRMSWPPPTAAQSAYTPTSLSDMSFGSLNLSPDTSRIHQSMSSIPVTYSEEGNDDMESEESDRDANIERNRLHFVQPNEAVDLDELERKYEDREFRGTFQKVMRPHFASESPFANIGKKSAEKAPRKAFLPQTSVIDDEGANKRYSFYICPRCKTRQREFFTVATAPRQLQGPSSYLALYFFIYVICSLFIFGLEEGWKPLDCIYFAVVTLTTAGLGDYVPTTDANKIICSIFIYFGVACIGLLLGSYIAGMLDDKAYHDRKSRQIEACPNCKRIQTIREAATKVQNRFGSQIERPARPQHLTRFMSERHVDQPKDHTAKLVVEHHHHSKPRSTGTASSRSNLSDGSNHSSVGLSTPNVSERKNAGTEASNNGLPPPPPPSTGPSPSASSMKSESPPNYLLGSPITRNILGRQLHTRHASIDVGSNAALAGRQVRRYSEELPSIPITPTIEEGKPLVVPTSAPEITSWHPDMLDGGSFSGSDEEDEEDDYSDSEASSVSTIDEIVDERTMNLKAAKYVFLTLKQALVNSMVIIAVGCMGFWLIEGFSLVDSWYFTTVFLTTVGYGDIVPVTKGGKLFATVYILVAGTILLNNMSLISMIPLELRKRRIERAVLTQFGDQLDDAALRELATGPVIQRLHLSANRPDGLDECTREMFSLAMLVRLGKVTEQDIRESFAAFRRLDVNDEGVLNSKSIIAAMIQKRRSLHGSSSMQNLQAAAAAQAGKNSGSSDPPPPPLSVQQQQQPPVPLSVHEPPHLPFPPTGGQSYWMLSPSTSSSVPMPMYAARAPVATSTVDERTSLLQQQASSFSSSSNPFGYGITHERAQESPF